MLFAEAYETTIKTIRGKYDVFVNPNSGDLNHLFDTGRLIDKSVMVNILRDCKAVISP